MATNKNGNNPYSAVSTTLHTVGAALLKEEYYPTKHTDKRGTGSDGWLKIAMRKLGLEFDIDYSYQKTISGQWIVTGRPSAAQEVLEYLFSLDKEDYEPKKVIVSVDVPNKDYTTLTEQAHNWIKDNKATISAKDMDTDEARFGGESSTMSMLVRLGSGKRGKGDGFRVEITMRDVAAKAAFEYLTNSGYNYQGLAERAIASFFTPSDVGRLVEYLGIPASTNQLLTTDYASANRSLPITTAKALYNHFAGNYEDATKWLFTKWGELATKESAALQASTNDIQGTLDSELSDPNWPEERAAERLADGIPF